MQSPLEPPNTTMYGLGDSQRQNIELSLREMTVHERLHMIVSFVRFVSMLMGEVATIAETIQAEEDNVQVEVDSEEAGVMQKFLVKGPCLTAGMARCSSVRW